MTSDLKLTLINALQIQIALFNWSELISAQTPIAHPLISTPVCQYLNASQGQTTALSPLMNPNRWRNSSDLGQSSSLCFQSFADDS